MYACIFIGNILDLFNHSLGNYHLLIKSCQIHLFVILLILSIADYYDLKFGIIPNKLSLILLIYGLLFNFILSVCFSNYHIFIFSIALNIFIVFFLALTREAYAVVIAFFLLIVKGGILLKYCKSR